MAIVISEILESLISDTHLSENQSRDLMELILKGELTESQLGAFLALLRTRKLSLEEIFGFATAMLKRSIEVTIKDPESAIDTCGTGGDKKGTINVSTLSAIVAASFEIPVAKHGNRGASSKTGSADLLEAFGVKIDLGPEKVSKCIDLAGIGFMFAPIYHPLLKHVAKVRSELGIRTIFNFLGPLANPAKVKRQILGVADPDLLEVIAKCLAKKGVIHAMVIHGGGGLDELSTLGTSTIFEIKNAESKNGYSIESYELDPSSLKLKRATIDELRGGDPELNKNLSFEVLSGQEGPLLDLVALNAAGALIIGGKARDFREGLEMALSLLRSGKALKTLDKLIKVSNEL